MAAAALLTLGTTYAAWHLHRLKTGRARPYPVPITLAYTACMLLLAVATLTTIHPQGIPTPGP